MSQSLIRRTEGHCPLCDGPIEYEDYDHSGNSLMYDCFCVNEACGWHGREVYDTVYAGFYTDGNNNNNQEVNNDSTRKRNDSSTQWDRENNN